MGIRAKTLIILASLFLVDSVGLGLIAQTVIMTGFGKVESENTKEDVQRAVDAFDYELTQINDKGTDWSSWDETYQFVQDHNQAYIDGNLSSDLIGQRIEFWLFYNKEGQLVQETGYDPKTIEPVRAPEAFLQALSKSGLTGLTEKDAAGKKAYFNLPDGNIMMTVARPIRINGEGPSAGTLVMANYLDAAKVKEQANLTHLSIHVYSVAQTGLPPDVTSYRDSNKTTIASVPVNDQTVTGYATIKAYGGGPNIIVRVDHTRDIYNQGRQAVNYFLGFFLLLFIGIMATAELLLNGFVIGPIQKLDRMKTELIYLASHQLRTPASAVRSNLSLLLDGYVGKLIDEQIRILRTAYEENGFELKLIDDVVDVAKLDSHDAVVEPKELDLVDLIKIIIVAQQSDAEKRNQSIETELPPELIISGDPVKLRLAFTNLIVNAIKYTPDGGRVIIGAKSSGSKVILTVGDNGIGIPANYIPDMFKRFSRASNATEINMAGAGLGLYLAKSMVGMHHGSIKVESELGKGSVFTVVLPKKYQP